MRNRHPANKIGYVKPLLSLIETRFDVSVPTDSIDHLRMVLEHYCDQRNDLLVRHGEAKALSLPNYAKAVMISEAARLILREIDPRPLKKKKKSKDIPPND